MAIDSGKSWSASLPGVKALLVFFIAANAGEEVAADACVNFTSTVDGAGDPGPGSGACLPYNVEIEAVAGTVLLSEASASAVSLAPTIDISVLVDESGSVPYLCGGTNDCYLNEQDFAIELISLLDDSVDLFNRGGTANYIEYSGDVNVNQVFTNKLDYISCKCEQLTRLQLRPTSSAPTSQLSATF